MCKPRDGRGCAVTFFLVFLNKTLKKTIELKKIFLTLIACAALVVAPSCSKDEGPGNNGGGNGNETPGNGGGSGDEPSGGGNDDTAAWEGGDWNAWPFAKGADVSYVTQMEDEGYVFRHVNGDSDDLMAILKQDCGVNATRLRVWVNPKPMKPSNPNIYNDKADVLEKALRAKANGLQVMIDFHFSDYWADPGKQYMPEAWKDFTPEQIKKAIREHVTDVLGTLRDNGVNPKWVQLGNEVTWGMLWNPDNPSGGANSGQPNGDDYSTPQHANFAGYVQASYDAVKTIDASICTIVHVTNAYEAFYQGYGNWIFNILKYYGVDYDMIGLSLYPSQAPGYTKTNFMSKFVTPAIANAKSLNSYYGKPVIFAEVGMPWDFPEGSVQMLTAIMNAAKTDKSLRGIFYWEPEVSPYWEAEGDGKQGYTLGGFNPNGNSPTNALSPFLTNID